MEEIQKLIQPEIMTFSLTNMHTITEEQDTNSCHYADIRK